MNSNTDPNEHCKSKYENIETQLKTSDKTEIPQILHPIFKRYETLSEQNFPKNDPSTNLKEKIFSLLTELLYIDNHIFKLFFQINKDLSRSHKDKIVKYIFSFGESITNSTIKVFLINNWNEQFQKIIKQYIDLVFELIVLHNDKLLDFTQQGELFYAYPYITYKNIKHAIMLILLFMTYIQDKEYLIDIIKFLISKTFTLPHIETPKGKEGLLKSDFTSHYINYYEININNDVSSDGICTYSNFIIQSPMIIIILLKALNTTKKYIDVFLHFIEFACRINDNNIKSFIRADIVKTLLLISEDIMNVTEQLNTEISIQHIQNIFKLIMKFLRKRDLLFIFNYMVITLNSVDGYITKKNTSFKNNILNSIADSILISSKYCKGIPLSNHNIQQTNIYNMIISPGVKLAYNGYNNIISVFQSYKRFTCVKDMKFVLLRIEKNKEMGSDCYLEISIDNNQIYIKENNIMKGISEQNIQMYMNLKKSSNFKYELNKNEGTVTIYINSTPFYCCSSNFVNDIITSSNNSFNIITGYMNNSFSQKNSFENYHHITLNYMMVYNDKLSNEMIKTINISKVKTSKMGTLKSGKVNIRYLTKDYYNKMMLAYKSNPNSNYFDYCFDEDDELRNKIVFELIVGNKKIAKKDSHIAELFYRWNIRKFEYIEYIPNTNYSNYEISNTNTNLTNSYLNHTYLITNYNIINTLKINKILQYGITKYSLSQHIAYVDTFLDDELNNMNIIKYIIVLLNDLDSIEDASQRKEMVLNLVNILFNYFKVNVYHLELFVNSGEYLYSFMYSLIKNKEYIQKDIIEKLFLLSFCIPKGFNMSKGKVEQCETLLWLFPKIITDLCLCFSFFNEMQFDIKKQILDLLDMYIINNTNIIDEYDIKENILTLYIDLFLQCQTTNKEIDSLFIKSIVNLINQLLKTQESKDITTTNPIYKYVLDEMARLLQILFQYKSYMKTHIKSETEQNEPTLHSCMGKLLDIKMDKYKEQILEKLLELNLTPKEISIVSKYSSLVNTETLEKNVNENDNELIEAFQNKASRSKSVAHHSGILLSPKTPMKEDSTTLQNKGKQVSKEKTKEDAWVVLVPDNKNGKVVFKEEDFHMNVCSCCLCDFVRKIIQNKLNNEHAFSVFKLFTTETYRDIFVIKDNTFFSKINTFNNNKILTVSNTSLSFSYYLSLKEGPNRIRRKFIVKPDLILNQEIDFTDKTKKQHITKYYFDKYSFHNSSQNISDFCKLDQLFSIQIVKSLLLKDDSYISSCNCLLLKGITYYNSVLILGKNKVYIFTNIIQDNNIIYPVGEKPLPKFFWTISEYESVLKEYVQKIKRNENFRESTPNEKNTIFKRLSKESRCFNFSYLDISELFKRKFLYQDNSFEIFLENGESLFIVVNISNRDKIVYDIIENYAGSYSQRKRILYNFDKCQNENKNDITIDKQPFSTPNSTVTPTPTPHHDNGNSNTNTGTNMKNDNVHNLYIQNKNNSSTLKSSTMFFTKNKHLFLMKKAHNRKIPKMKDHAILEVKQLLSDITDKWSIGIISNYSYLMILNTLSGRTYNDLSQYPILPWVISDYESDTISITNPSTYRNFSYPIFAQKQEMRDELQLKYESCDSKEMKYHSGSHYSTPAFLSYYLIRIKPFSLTAAEIQGGIFDIPDRLFFNINNLYKIEQKYQELIPEIFTLPELFININNYYFGKSNKETISDVQLPLWSCGDPRLFSKMLMKAIESCYVSENLQDWIDLIFGSKQKGKDAIKCYNIFRSACYSFDPNKIINQNDIGVNVNSSSKKAIYEDLDQKVNEIVDMGQCPTVLFSKLHPKKERHQELIAFFGRSVYAMNFIPEKSKYSIEVQPKEIFAYYENVNEYMSHGQGGLASFRMCYQEYMQNSNKGNDKYNASPIYFLVGKKCTLVPPSYKNYIDWSRTKYSFLLVKPFKQICYEYYLHHKSAISYIKASTDGKHIIVGFCDGLLCKYKFKKMKYDSIQMSIPDEQKKKTKKGFIKKIFKKKTKDKESEFKHDRTNINTLGSITKENIATPGCNSKTILLSQTIDISPSNTFNKDSFLTKTNNNFIQYSPSIYFLNPKHMYNYCKHCTSAKDIEILIDSKNKKHTKSYKNIYLFLINSTKAISSKISLIDICECYSLLIVIDVENNIHIYDLNTFTLQKQINFNVCANDNSDYKIKNISINQYTGDFIVATEFQIMLFNINGVILAKINLVQFSIENKQCIYKINHCIIKSIKSTESDVYIFTAHIDGSVLIWKIENKNILSKKASNYKYSYDSRNVNACDIELNLKFNYMMRIKCPHNIKLIKLTEDLRKMICVTADKNLIYLSYEEYLEKKKKTKQSKICPNCVSEIGSSKILCNLCNKKLCSKCKIEEKIPEYSLKNKIPICQDCKGLIMSTNKMLYDF